MPEPLWRQRALLLPRRPQVPFPCAYSQSLSANSHTVALFCFANQKRLNQAGARDSLNLSRRKFCDKRRALALPFRLGADGAAVCSTSGPTLPRLRIKRKPSHLIARVLARPNTISRRCGEGDRNGCGRCSYRPPLRGKDPFAGEAPARDLVCWQTPKGMATYVSPYQGSVGFTLAGIVAIEKSPSSH